MTIAGLYNNVASGTTGRFINPVIKRGKDACKPVIVVPGAMKIKQTSYGRQVCE